MRGMVSGVAPGRGALGSDDRELLRLLADGWSQSAIACALDLTLEDLRALIRGIFDRLGIAGPSPSSAARLLLVQEATHRAPAGD